MHYEKRMVGWPEDYLGYFEGIKVTLKCVVYHTLTAYLLGHPEPGSGPLCGGAGVLGAHGGLHLPPDVLPPHARPEADPAVELETKVIRMFPKISQSRRRPLLGPSPG